MLSEQTGVWFFLFLLFETSSSHHPGDLAWVSFIVSAGTDEAGETRTEPLPRGCGGQRTFPDGDDVPAEGAEGGFVAEIVGAVAVESVGCPVSDGTALRHG